MNRRRNLVPGQDDSVHEMLDHAETVDERPYETSSQEEVYEDQYWEEVASPPKATWLAPALFVFGAILWTVFFAWVNHQPMLAGAAPSQWVDWIVQLSVPLVLLSGLYLIVMRNSRREANRFTDAARALSQESAQLESRLAVVNRELALARDFIESQSRDLESLGRMASERLSTNADHLQSLIRDNTAQVENIIRTLKEQGEPVILISHNMRQVMDLMDRIVVFRRGRIVADLRKEETDGQDVVAYITGAKTQEQFAGAA